MKFFHPPGNPVHNNAPARWREYLLYSISNDIYLPLRLAAFLRGALFFLADFFFAAFLRAVFFFGTFAPALRASDKPIAIACLRLVTFLPEPPLRRVPFFFSRITFFTLSCAFLEYFAISFLNGLKILCHANLEALSYIHNMKNVLAAALLLFLFNSSLANGKEQTVQSPDGNILVNITVADEVSYTIHFKNQLLVSSSKIALNLRYRMPMPLVIQKATTRANSSIIYSPVPEKRKQIPDVYNEVTIQFRQPVSVQFRVYNDGVAYRWQTRIRDSVIIENEIAETNFPANHPVYFSEVVKRADQDIFHTSFEEPYSCKPLDSISNASLIFSPLLVMPETGPKVLLTESDLFDYPGMFLTGTSNRGLTGKFAPYPQEEIVTTGEFPQANVLQRADYIAHTSGTRSFPWRVVAIAAHDKELPANDIVYRLGAPSKLADHSWIRPGKGTDEWIIGINLFNVPFKAGINTATYKYYIDFAKQFGFDRIMMDAGWSDYKDLFKINPDLDMNEIAAYAKSKGIGLSMWTLAMTLDKQLEPALDQFNKWGVDFIMTDFMDRDDQKMVNFYHRIAEACARHKIMIMYHGAFKPAGFSRTWPNAITREGVLGSEYNIWSEKATPEHNVLLPFIRMVAGPMDYEPGILDNATKETFRPIGSKVMAPGTRCHQLAMFVVYESPIQIFSGNPSQGMTEPAFMHLLGSIPTTWDTTMVLDGKVGDYIITARKKNNDWFVAGMTDWTARELSVDLSFLDNGNYELVSCTDGINADRYASDYVLKESTIDRNKPVLVKLAPGGGFVMRLRKK
jgi:alpha-glucosidase